jgi:hypothetical protein
MQPVWPRARLAGRQTTAKFLRRISTASETIRTNSFHSGTLLYGSALAAAAYADGLAKLRAKREFEEEVGAKREEVQHARQTTQEIAQRYLLNRLGITIDNDSEQFEEILKELEQLDQTEPPEMNEKLQQRQEEAQLKRLLYYAPYLQVRRAKDIPTTIPFSYWKNPPQSPWASRSMRALAQNRAWVPKKIYRAELCAMRLTIELLLHSGLFNKFSTDMPYYVQSYAKLSESELQQILTSIEVETIRINSLSHLVKPVHMDFGVLEPYYDPSSTNDTLMVQELNRKLFKILSEWHAGGEGKLTTHATISICESILRSPVHPDTHTMNILLTMFSARNQDDLMDLVWDFATDVNLRPNEITLVQMLRSYNRRSNPQRFLLLVSQMRGRSGALMLANPEFPEDLIEKTVGRVFPLYPWSTLEDTKLLVQAVTPSPLVFQEIIRGLLDFVGLDTTLTICKDLAEYGWGLSYDCIHMLLRKCAIESAWDTGVKVWRETEQLITQGHPIPADVYALMLAFCHLLKDKKLFKILFEQGIRTWTMDPVILVSRVRQEICHIRYQQMKGNPRLCA